MISKILAWHSAKGCLHRKVRLVASLMALVCATSSLAIAGGNQLESTSDLDEFIVCDDPARQWNPHVDNSTIVWSDGRNADDDIYGYDLNTQSEFTICAASGYQGGPSIHGNIVVWQDRRNPDTDPDVYGYDLSTRTEFPICTESHGQGTPAIYENYVVWQDSRAASDNQDIYGYDLNTDIEFPICTAEGSQVGPVIYGDIVVWMDYRNETNPSGCWPDCNTDIYGYNLATGTEFAICTDTSFQGYPAIYGDTVLWIDDRNGNWDIYGYNLTTHEEFTVCLDPTDQVGVSLNQDWIVWPDKRNDPNPATCDPNCNYDIYGMRRDTGTEVALVTDPARQFQPSLDGNVLYWTDSRNDPDPIGCGVNCNFDIYGAALVSGEASVPGGSTLGVGLDAPIVLEFALPMDPLSVTYTCTPDPGGWAEMWNDTLRLAATSTVLTLTHNLFVPSTSYAFTVTAGVDVLGRAIEPFGMTFTTSAVRIYLPMVIKNH